MEHRLGFAPHIIYEPYPSYVRSTTAALLGGERRKPETFYWYEDAYIAYVGEGDTSFYTGPTTYRVIRRGL